MNTNEIETLDAFIARATIDPKLHGVFIQSVDFSNSDALTRVNPAGAVFLGCDLTADQATFLRTNGALIFPKLPDLPFDPYRSELYSPNELYSGLDHLGYPASPDAAIYAWAKAHDPHDLSFTLAASLHDHAISDALADASTSWKGQRIVGVMGGHAIQRGSTDYAAAAQLGLALATQGMLVVSGGGPGAMEASNLGAWMSVYPSRLDDALDLVARTPSFRPSIDEWAKAAFAVCRDFPAGTASLGIPTWFYGHEPPNAFASHIAKFFSNAIREDTLLTLCRGGLIYLPGAAGTVQELFQAVTGNYYASDPATVAPLVLVGVKQWTETLPAWPLLKTIARGKVMADRIALVDTVAEAWQWLDSLA